MHYVDSFDVKIAGPQKQPIVPTALSRIEQWAKPSNGITLENRTAIVKALMGSSRGPLELHFNIDPEHRPRISYATCRSAIVQHFAFLAPVIESVIFFESGAADEEDKDTTQTSDELWPKR